MTAISVEFLISLLIAASIIAVLAKYQRIPYTVGHSVPLKTLVDTSYLENRPRDTFGSAPNPPI